MLDRERFTENSPLTFIVDRMTATESLNILHKCFRESITNQSTWVAQSHQWKSSSRQKPHASHQSISVYTIKKVKESALENRRVGI